MRISDLSEAIGQGSWAQGTMAGIGAADAWRSQGQVLTGALESLAEGISSGLGVAATLVQVVHDMVRDLIAEAIGMFFQSVLEEVFTLGLATPAVAAQISTWVADKVTKVTRRVNDLISSFQALSKLLNKIQPIVTRLKSVLDKIGSVTDKAAGTGHGPDDAMGQHQTRRHRPELQGHLHPQRRRPVGRRWPSARR